MKIVVIHGFWIADEAMAILNQVAQVVYPRDPSDQALRAEIADADVLVVSFYPRVDRELLEAAPRLKQIARLGVGMDNIDLPAATERGILVTNTPDLTADAVAEFTMTLLLSLAKHIPQCDRAVREDRWPERLDIIRVNRELNGKTHGIVGLGKIGRRVAVRCQAFGMRVIYHKRNRDLELERTLGVDYVPLNTLLAESDSISLHVPLTAETKNMFDRTQFKAMKKGAFLINQARGKVVNEAALIEALKEGQIAGYATDVYEKEPPDRDWELLRLRNVVVTPHVGGGTIESRTRACVALAEDMARVLRGEVPKHLVNREAMIPTG
jgi:D-3-phosphoglycerate dehydrogenase